jgi:hypothetical protein
MEVTVGRAIDRLKTTTRAHGQTVVGGLIMYPITTTGKIQTLSNCFRLTTMEPHITSFLVDSSFRVFFRKIVFALYQTKLALTVTKRLSFE